MLWYYAMQESLSKSHGSQCGFCTPGFIMSMYALLRNNPQPSALDMENAFQGTFCSISFAFVLYVCDFQL